MSLGGDDHQTGALAIPPRSLRPTRVELPLLSMRMTIKDMFDLKGHRTGLGSRAYIDCAVASTSTAPCIKRLLDTGASLIGVTQLCALVGKTEPTQTIDYEAPWNPRADGFQSPSGGSSGQASAMATYSWLDFAIGSDATVSGRAPAQANGCFSLRPSVGILSTVGMWSAVSRFDTPCVFARDISVVEKVIRSWYSSTGSRKARPDSILYPTDFLPTGNHQQMKVVGDFLSDASACLSCPVQRFSTLEMWTHDPPAEAGSLSLKDFLDHETATQSYVYDFWQKISQFQRLYREKIGHEAFFPLPKGRDLWEDAKNVTPEQNRAAWRRIDVYRMWFLDKILKPTQRNAIVIMPIGDVKPNYRDEWPRMSKEGQQMWEPLLLAPILGAPELVVPAGQIPYWSRVSAIEEHLPVCLSVMGLPNTDHDLVDIVQEILNFSGRPTMVKTGKTMF